MEDILSSNEYLKFLSELQKRDVRFMVVGMAAAALQGATFATVEFDLWLENLSDPNFHEAVQSVGGTYLPPIPLPPLLVGKALEPFDLVTGMSGLGKFEEEYSRVLWVEVGGVKTPLLPMDRIIASKRAANREKDKLVLPVLEALARTLEALKEEKNRT